MGAAPAPDEPATAGGVREIRDAIAAARFQTFLLHGVTGSGKTEVYLNAIETALAAGRSALLLVPEIALTPAVAGQFFARFGDRVAILHSAFHDAERAEQWRRIRSGAACVVVGTRSAVFAPVPNLGLIVVDEEHDDSYKQEETPRYNGRDVAIVRAQRSDACVVLGSATPSLESRYNADRGQVHAAANCRRASATAHAGRSRSSTCGRSFWRRASRTPSRAADRSGSRELESGEQTILLLNRRGFSSFVACRACGERVQCVNCAVALTYHRRDRRLLCHYCNYAEKVPTGLPEVRSEHIYFLGIGSENVEEELHRALSAGAHRAPRSRHGHRQAPVRNDPAGFREGNYDILVGTQMIAKGHDIPNVTLVGVVSADIGLGMPDFRAAERTFQLLTQVAGRAGRGDLPGIVLVQTINPDHYAVRFAAAQDYQAFYEKELEFRRLMHYPPFSAHGQRAGAQREARDALRLSGELGQFLQPAEEGMKLHGAGRGAGAASEERIPLSVADEIH